MVMPHDAADSVAAPPAAFVTRPLGFTVCHTQAALHCTLDEGWYNQIIRENDIWANGMLEHVNKYHITSAFRSSRGDWKCICYMQHHLPIKKSWK
jgi:hypothetical protein